MPDLAKTASDSAYGSWPDRLEMMPQIEPARLQLICNNF